MHSKQQKAAVLERITATQASYLTKHDTRRVLFSAH